MPHTSKFNGTYLRPIFTTASTLPISLQTAEKAPDNINIKDIKITSCWAHPSINLFIFAKKDPLKKINVKTIAINIANMGGIW